jgi:hypothetical protein
MRMTSESPSQSATRALRGLAIAIVVALVLLFTVVLPAERGYDPTGIGRKLGLMAMSDQRTAAAASISDVTGGNENLAAAAGASAMDPLPLPNPAVSQLRNAAPRTDTIEVTLGFDEKTEIKAQLDKAQVIVYDWSVEGGEVYVDFHGHDPSKGDAYWVRYEEADGITHRSGSLVAPFSGEHGWYWLNVSDKPVKIRLTVTGYQNKLINYGLLQ